MTKKLVLIAAAVVLVGGGIFVNRKLDQFRVTLPTYQRPPETVLLAQTWTTEQRQQFHHTAQGTRILENFVFNICGCERDWNPGQRIALVEDQIRGCVGDRNVFFFVSGGVDSTVAFTLCLRALGPSRVCGVYVDTGLMREGETEFVERTFAGLSAGMGGEVDVE